MNRRPIAALSLAATLALAPLTPALAAQPEDTPEEGRSWFSLNLDITGEEQSFLEHLASWFDRDEEEPPATTPGNAPVGVPAADNPGKKHGHHKDHPGHKHGHDKWWKDKDKEETPPDGGEGDTPDEGDAPDPDDGDSADVSAEVQAVLDHHNELRTAQDPALPPLTLSPAMSTVAQDWSEEQAAAGDMSHNDDYATEIPEGASSAAENVGFTTLTGAEAVTDLTTGWEESEGHRDNILGDYTHVGIGLATSEDGATYGTVVFASYTESPDGEEGTPPATGETTGGGGGEFTNEEVTFTSNGQTSTYRIYAEGRTGTPGLIFWTDGTGGYGYENPDSDYLIGGEQGMEAIARERNMILVVPLAPGSDNVWYDDEAEEKAQWSADLMTEIKAQYDIDQDRIVIGGYSSGAQWTTRYFLPAHGEEQSVDLAVAVGGGGDPASTTQFSDAYKASTVIVHNTGTADNEDGYDAYSDAQSGEEWYRANDFTTDPEWPEGVTHDRGEEFGGIVAEEIDQHLGG